MASYLLSIYIPTAQATSAIVNPHQNSYDNSLSVLPSASPIPRFYPSTERVTASTKHSGRYSGLAQLSYRPSSHILLLSTILFTSLLFSSLTSCLPKSLPLFQKQLSFPPDHFPPASSRRFTRIPTPLHATPPHRHLIIAAPTYTITQSRHPITPIMQIFQQTTLNKPISASHAKVML